MGRDVRGAWRKRKLQDEELFDLLCSACILCNRMIKSVRMRWAEHTVRHG
jgi:hypothetical protein